MSIVLKKCQVDAVNSMKNGCILCGGVGSGKSLTSLSYFFKEECDGDITDGIISSYNKPIKKPRDLYIITTARKRDSFEWDKELLNFVMHPGDNSELYGHNIIIDSWNNIVKYKKVHGAFFIFDEQRVVGSGAWVKAFLDIARKNKWILLSATPGDIWNDYLPVFIANGFFKNKKEFNSNHVVFSPYTKFPKIERYIGTKKLERLRDSILVNIDMYRETQQIHNSVYVGYDKDKYKYTSKTRFNPYTNEPIINAAELCYTLRKIVNSDISRIQIVFELCKKFDRVIIFYNFNYELELLREIPYGDDYIIAEWNGQKHQPIPDSKKWIYLVQYTAGAEGWNCITTNVIIFYSQNYSYKIMHQSAGRIDRMNTPYKDLYYYHIKSKSNIDLAIDAALREKRNFNERRFLMGTK